MLTLVRTMGYVKVKATLGSAQRTVTREVEFLADTGAFYTIVPPDLAKGLDIQPSARTRVTLADKRMVEVDVSLAYIKVLDREGIFLIAIMDAPEPLLGTTVFEGLGLRIDPSTGNVEYSRPYGLAVL